MELAISMVEFSDIRERVFSYGKIKDRLDEWAYIFKYELGYNDDFYYSYNFLNGFGFAYATFFHDSGLLDFSLNDEPYMVGNIVSRNKCLLFRRMYDCLEKMDYLAFCNVLEQFDILLENMKHQGIIDAKDHQTTLETLENIQEVYNNRDDNSLNFKMLKACYDIVITDLKKNNNNGFYID